MTNILNELESEKLSLEEKVLLLVAETLGGIEDACRNFRESLGVLETIQEQREKDTTKNA